MLSDLEPEPQKSPTTHKRYGIILCVHAPPQGYTVYSGYNMYILKMSARKKLPLTRYRSPRTRPAPPARAALPAARAGPPRARRVGGEIIIGNKIFLKGAVVDAGLWSPYLRIGFSGHPRGA